MIQSYEESKKMHRYTNTIEQIGQLNASTKQTRYENVHVSFMSVPTLGGGRSLFSRLLGTWTRHVKLTVRAGVEFLVVACQRRCPVRRSVCEQLAARLPSPLPRHLHHTTHVLSMHGGRELLHGLPHPRWQDDLCCFPLLGCTIITTAVVWGADPVLLRAPKADWFPVVVGWSPAGASFPLCSRSGAPSGRGLPLSALPSPSVLMSLSALTRVCLWPSAKLKTFYIITSNVQQYRNINSIRYRNISEYTTLRKHNAPLKSTVYILYWWQDGWGARHTYNIIHTYPGTYIRTYE